MSIVKAPGHWDNLPTPFLFLAGSIEMGTAPKWQDEVGAALEHDATVLNPRRDNWDPSWRQSIDDPQFRFQVEWELRGLARADLALFYFAPGTKSPISLLELGLFHSKAIVCCPEGFWRKGNVDVVCNHFGVRTVPTLELMPVLVLDQLEDLALRR